jgi:Transposase DDE domain group 1
LFDDRNLVSQAGLVPLAALAERAGLHGRAAALVRPDGDCGANAGLKVACLAAGMAAGADSIDGMDLLRHGAMDRVFGGVRAPSTLGSFLRAFTWGNVSQLQKAHREFLAALARQAPLLPGAQTLAFIDIDSTQKRVYGYRKQGARFGHTKIQGKSLLVKGLNALAGVISTPLSAPVIGAVRLRGGNAASSRGAASLAKEVIGTARECGCTGTIIVRLDSGYYSAAVISAIRSREARFSVTVPMNSSVRAAIAAIGEDAWTPIRYPRAIWDDQLGCWVSDAEVAEIEYTAFTSKKNQQVTARLIVRRVRDQNKKAAQGQGELFPVWRYHAVFTDSPFETIQSEGQHRGHAVVEQVFADWYDGPVAHLPSGIFNANAAWLVIAAMAQNLVRAAGSLAGPLHAKARAATIRRDLIAVAARAARHGRGHLTLHLPEGWHREHEWLNLWHAACGPPATA